MKNYCEMGKGYADTIAECHNLPKEMRDHIETAYVQGARAVSVYSGLSLNDYQEKAMTTCMESCNNFSYMFLNLVGEVGEFASKIAKLIRREEAYIMHNELTSDTLLLPDGADEAIRKELGDILWQLSGVCGVMGWTLEEVAEENLVKLAARKAAGTIDGNGDGISGAERSTGTGR